MQLHLSISRLTTLVTLLAASNLPVAAQVELVPERFTFALGASFDTSIPSPEDFMGYRLGEEITPYHRVLDYLNLVASASDRITMHHYGSTHEGRPLHYTVATSSANQARIESIRTNNLRLADPGSLSDADAGALIQTHPAVSWLSFGVHGNEASSTEAALQVVYRLAVGRDAETMRILDESVVIIDPCINPDGRDRYMSWYRSMKSDVVNTDSGDLEHDEPWPGGRTNHYWFDLNRDWVWLVHPESQGRIEAYQRWLPQIHVDYHEQGYNNNYFTMPGTTPRNLLLPDGYDTWTDRFGKANAEMFDRLRISYFTTEAFDFFYPGYGSSYPSLMGAIGMLTEQGGGSRGARAVETDDGHVLTLRQRIFDHYQTSLASLATVVEHRPDLLAYFRAAFSQTSNKSDVAAYIVANDSTDYTYGVLAMLMKHGIRVEQAVSSFSTRRAFGFEDGKPAPRTFGAGTFLIRTDQPRHVLLNTLMQRRLAIEDSVMYDMATWSAPLAYNLDAAWTESMPEADTRPLMEAPRPPSGLTGVAEDVYAYVIDWRQSNAPAALSLLWQAGFKVRSHHRGFSTQGYRFNPGTLVILMGRNLEMTHKAKAEMERIANTAGVRIHALPSGRVDEGHDLASRYSRSLKSPKVGILVDEPFSSYTAGQIWYLFDKATGLGVSRLRNGSLSRLELGRYDVLVMPGFSGEAPLDSTAIERLRVWVRNGGTLVGTEKAALWLTEDRSGITDVALAEDDAGQDASDRDVDGESEVSERPDPSYYTRYESREDSAGLKRIPGSALLGHVDTSHPLAFGVKDRVYSLVFSDEALEPSDELHTVGYYEPSEEDLLVAGYVSDDHRRKLAGRTFAAVRQIGRGRVVFLKDNTQYRMFWLGPARMMQNAVMLVPSM